MMKWFVSPFNLYGSVRFLSCIIIRLYMLVY